MIRIGGPGPGVQFGEEAAEIVEGADRSYYLRSAEIKEEFLLFGSRSDQPSAARFGRCGPEHADGTEVESVAHGEGLGSGVEQYPGPESTRSYRVQLVPKPLDMA